MLKFIIAIGMWVALIALAINLPIIGVPLIAYMVLSPYLMSKRERILSILENKHLNFADKCHQLYNAGVKKTYTLIDDDVFLISTADFEDIVINFEIEKESGEAEIYYSTKDTPYTKSI